MTGATGVAAGRARRLRLGRGRRRSPARTWPSSVPGSDVAVAVPGSEAAIAVPGRRAAGKPVAFGVPAHTVRDRERDSRGLVVLPMRLGYG
ncbi:hypothetical protein Ate01nite_59170 [Actinoplanes teichomyceticus]|nr:hypothetical protein Ate01nite_59170 [Actinoplanes teichomyceticus]